jgi:hypothetical protein
VRIGRIRSFREKHVDFSTDLLRKQFKNSRKETHLDVGWFFSQQNLLNMGKPINLASFAKGHHFGIFLQT